MQYTTYKVHTKIGKVEVEYRGQKMPSLGMLELMKEKKRDSKTEK